MYYSLTLGSLYFTRNTFLYFLNTFTLSLFSSPQNPQSLNSSLLFCCILFMQFLFTLLDTLWRQTDCWIFTSLTMCVHIGDHKPFERYHNIISQWFHLCIIHVQLHFCFHDMSCLERGAIFHLPTASCHCFQLTRRVGPREQENGSTNWLDAKTGNTRSHFLFPSHLFSLWSDKYEPQE